MSEGKVPVMIEAHTLQFTRAMSEMQRAVETFNSRLAKGFLRAFGIGGRPGERPIIVTMQDGVTRRVWKPR